MEQQHSTTLLLTSNKSLLQMRETDNYCKETWETKSDKKAILCGSHLKVFSKDTAHESQRIPVSNLLYYKDFEGIAETNKR